MIYVAINKNGDEHMFDIRPKRNVRLSTWEIYDGWSQNIKLPKGTIKKLIGRDLTWEDNYIEIK